MPANDVADLLFFLFLSSFYALFYLFISEHGYFITLFLQRLYTVKSAGSWMMLSIHCGNAVFPYQVLERKPVQEILIGCVRLHSIKI
jgi:hypothetical protein